MITVRVANAAKNVEAVRIDALELRHTSPRPRGQATTATAGAQGLPITVAPGEGGEFAEGAYELVQTDEDMKANLPLRAYGVGLNSGLPFQLGINVHLRGAGAEGGSDSPPSGPPPWAGGRNEH
jgi:hypothetical protein